MIFRRFLKVPGCLQKTFPKQKDSNWLGTIVSIQNRHFLPLFELIGPSSLYHQGVKNSLLARDSWNCHVCRVIGGPFGRQSGRTSASRLPHWPHRALIDGTTLPGAAAVIDRPYMCLVIGGPFSRCQCSASV